MYTDMQRGKVSCLVLWSERTCKCPGVYVYTSVYVISKKINDELLSHDKRDIFFNGISKFEVCCVDNALVKSWKCKQLAFLYSLLPRRKKAYQVCCQIWPEPLNSCPEHYDNDPRFIRASCWTKLKYRIQACTLCLPRCSRLQLNNILRCNKLYIKPESEQRDVQTTSSLSLSRTHQVT